MVPWGCIVRYMVVVIQLLVVVGDSVVVGGGSGVLIFHFVGTTVPRKNSLFEIFCGRIGFPPAGLVFLRQDCGRI